MLPIRAAATLFILLLAAGCASVPPPETPRKPPPEVTPMVGAEAILYTWTQLGPGGAMAKAVLAGPARPCPEIRLDDLPAAGMTARPGSGHPITICEHPLALPDGRPASRAQVADRLLPLPGTTPPRIAVIGSTGTGSFAPAAKTIARRQMPTLVIHTGGYTSGDTWEEWERDFFLPADELLQVAPWLMVNGNQESCNLLGTSPTCAPDAPFAVDLVLGNGDTQRLIVSDSVALAGELATPSSWLLAHPPLCRPDGVELVLAAQDGPPHFLMLAWDPGARSWQGTLSGDASRTCQLKDCGFPAADPCEKDGSRR